MALQTDIRPFRTQLCLFFGLKYNSGAKTQGQC